MRCWRTTPSGRRAATPQWLGLSSLVRRWSKRARAKYSKRLALRCVAMFATLSEQCAAVVVSACICCIAKCNKAAGRNQARGMRCDVVMLGILDDTITSSTQVTANAMRYVESQPWPFPRSLMISFTAALDPASTSGSVTDSLSRQARDAAATSGITAVELSTCAFFSCTLAAQHRGCRTMSRFCEHGC